MEQVSEFIANHPLLVMAFVVIAVLLIATEARRGGKSLAPSLVGGIVNRQEGVLLDIRPDADFRAGHIAGSIGIPQSQLATRIDELKKYQGKPLIVVCNLGNSANDVANALIKAGHAPVYCLAGGITAWRGENLPVVRS
jgi:rhodanese-related sulfurtransferase